MAKQSTKQKEIKKQLLVKKYKTKRSTIKQQIKKSHLFSEQIKLQKQLQKLPRNSSPHRLRNRCWVTGRSRGVYSDFGLSRHVLREMSHECLLPGVRKASW